MTRTCEELIDYAYRVPREPLLAITVAEARQLGVHTGTNGLLCGRPCIVIDLPPHHFLSTNGEVYPK